MSLIVGLFYCLWPAGSATQIGSMSIPTVVWLSFAFSFFAPWWSAQSFTAIANLAAPGERAFVSSLLILSITLFGAGLGPVFTGVLSDALNASAGDDALRYALAATVAMTLIPTFLYLAAAPAYRRSLSAAEPQIPLQGSLSTQRS